MQFTLSTAVVALAVLVGTAFGETHTVHLENNCDIQGAVPLLMQGGNIISTGSPYIANASLVGAIAYLQTGDCGTAGENCTTVELTLQNRNETNSGSFANTDTSFPRAFSVPAGFTFSNGCDENGAYCAVDQCPEQDVVVLCKADNVDLNVRFCDKTEAA